LEGDARSILAIPAGKLANALYRRVGVTNFKSLLGLPKGPYYDAVDTTSIRVSLESALRTRPDEPTRTAQNDVAGPIRKCIWTLRDRIVATIQRELKLDPDALYRIEPRDFEHVVAEILRDMGYDVYLTPQTRDGGRDILAYIT
jgi:hypothetical protein